METLSDKQLLKRFAEGGAGNGAERAFTELGRRYTRLVYATCLRELQDRALAEDASQTVFLLLSRKAASLQKQESPAGWLFTTSRFVSQNLRRQETRRKAYEEKAMTESPVQDTPENHLWNLIEPHLNDALESLKPSDREAILLRFFEEKTLAETGALLNLSENTARMKINRAIEKLRTHLAKAGVAVSGTLLASLLTQKSAEASVLVPASLSGGIAQIAKGGEATSGSPLSSSVLQLAQKTTRALLRAKLGSIGLSLLLGSLVLSSAGVGIYRAFTPKISSETRRATFAALAGVWRGNLEYADDGDGVHHTYRTTIELSASPNSNTLTYRATYTGSTRADTWTGTLDLKSGDFVTVGNQDGVNKRLTYKTEGLKAFATQKSGTFMLTTHDNLAAWDTKQTVSLNGNKLTWGEDVRRDGSAFRFRNLFTLTRAN
ncbi:MAG: sigma-70 family RNA polymerase sigma factor [Chthonomonadaceae bacterium]|nr:sigma-70 family RNA polymerase sigma factor [Chthonomonadaceae bacterium]